MPKPKFFRAENRRLDDETESFSAAAITPQTNLRRNRWSNQAPVKFPFTKAEFHIFGDFTDKAGLGAGAAVISAMVFKRIAFAAAASAMVPGCPVQTSSREQSLWIDLLECGRQHQPLN